MFQNPNNLKSSIENIYGLDQNKFLSLLNSKDINKINEIFIEKSNLFELAGRFRPIKNLEDRDQVVHQTINWFLFGKTRIALEVMKEGQIEKHLNLFRTFLYTTAREANR